MYKIQGHMICVRNYVVCTSKTPERRECNRRLAKAFKSPNIVVHTHGALPGFSVFCFFGRSGELSRKQCFPCGVRLRLLRKNFLSESTQLIELRRFTELLINRCTVFMKSRHPGFFGFFRVFRIRCFRVIGNLRLQKQNQKQQLSKTNWSKNAVF